jgi:EAL domain-containing protein (putative c-di-GMP-specific phosphodiesterase class I)
MPKTPIEESPVPRGSATGGSITEAELRRAVDRGQLRAHYQPKVMATRTGWEVIAIESLLRWQHPEHGLLMPDRFIALAETHGLIGGLTDYVLQTGIDQLGEWNRVGLRLGLCVNLSPLLVTDSEFPDRLGALLAARRVDPEQLTLEMTETAALTDPACTLGILSRLRLKRIGLSLDDFGTGYSSLTQLYRLPFNEVKIDRSIGVDLPNTTAARSIVRAIIDLGHGAGLQVCCEGVENAAALEFLHRAGCDYAQGYHIARPMAPDALARWIAESPALMGDQVRAAS